MTIATVATGTAANRSIPASVRSGLRITALAYRVARLWWLASRTPELSPGRLRDAASLHGRRMVESVGVRVRTRGLRPSADQPVVLVANHISWIDPYVISAVCGARFVAKSDVAEWPVVRTIAGRFGSFFHDRGNFRDARRTVGALRDALQDGFAVGFFPEATTTSGCEVLPFYPAFFEAAVEAGAPVQTVAIRYLDDRGRPIEDPAYINEVGILDTIRAMSRRPVVEAEVHFGPRLNARGMSRRELAETANARIAELLALSPQPGRFAGSGAAERWSWQRAWSPGLGDIAARPCAGPGEELDSAA